MKEQQILIPSSGHPLALLKKFLIQKDQLSQRSTASAEILKTIWRQMMMIQNFHFYLKAFKKWEWDLDFS